MRRLLLSLALLSLVASTALAASIAPGDILVTGVSATGHYVAAVSPVTGTVQVISSGGLIVNPWTVAQGPDKFVYVGVPASIIRVNPATGSQNVFSTNLSVNGMMSLSVMILHSNGDFYYTSAGKVVRVNSTTGAQSLITPTSVDARGIVEGRDHQLYVASELNANTLNVVAVQRVDPNTGAASPVATGAIGKTRGIAFDMRDSLYVETFNERGVFRINYTNGTLGYLTGADNSYTTSWMIAHPDGKLYFTHNTGTGIARVDRQNPVNGAKSILSQGGLLGQAVVGINVATDFPIPAATTTWGRVKTLYR